MENELDAAYEGLFIAAEHGRADVLKALLEHGKNVLKIPEIRNKNGLTPLHIAVINQKSDAVRTLLATGFPSNAKVESKHLKYAGMTSYEIAVNQAPVRTMMQVFLQYMIQEIAMNHVDTVESLLDAGVDPITATDGSPQDNSLLHWAACSNSIQVMELLIRNTSDEIQRQILLNRRNSDGITALHEACHGNFVECVQILVENGSDLSIVGTAGYGKDKTPVEVATNKEITRIIAKGRINRPSPSLPTSEVIQVSVIDQPLKEPEMVTEEIPLAPVSNARYQIQPSSDPSLLLEEKQALIDELKQTIDELVTDSHDQSLLGDEQVVLNFIRKLREEKQMVERQLHDAEEHIFVQEELMIELKAQIRRHNAVVENLQKEIETLKADKVATEFPTVQPLAMNLATADEAMDDDEATVLTSLPLTSSEPTTPASKSFWSSIFYYLWPFADEETLPDMPTISFEDPLHDTILTV